MGALVGDFEISSEPVGALVGGFGYDCSILTYRLTVARSIPSSLAIRLIDQPCRFNVVIVFTIANLS
jgi:hypothetical protein